MAQKERKFMDYPSYLVGIVFFAICMVCFGFLAYHGHTVDSIEPREQVVPWHNEVEDAVEIAEVENHNTLFVRVSGIFSATEVGSDSVATTTLNIDTPEQFASLVPENEKIYVDISTTNQYESHYVDRTYYAFIENRTGLYRYNERYEKAGYEPADITEEGILFIENVDSDNDGKLWMQWIGWIGVFASLIAAFYVAGAWATTVSEGPWAERQRYNDW